MSTTGEIIQGACEDAGICSFGQVVNAAQISRCMTRLKNIINFQATQGVKVWLEEDVSIPLTAGKGKYILGPTGDVVMTRPLQCLQGYYLTAQGVQQPLTVLSKQEFATLSQVNINAAISSYYADKQATFMAINTWNVPDATAATGTVHVILRVACASPTAMLDVIVFPPEWSIFLQWELASQISTGQPKEIREDAVKFASSFRTALEGFDVEDASTLFQPDSRTGYGRRSFR